MRCQRELVEVNNTDEWTRIEKSRYDGTCAGCGNKYAKDQAIFVCNGKYFDKVQCVELVYTGALEKGKSEQKEQYSKESSSKIELVRCDNCGRMVPHVTHIIQIAAREIDMSICDDCEWLRVASWNLKLNGMWKPTPKYAPIQEAKA